MSDGDDGYKDGMNLVIFGDSWVDNTVRVGEEARGKSWTEVLCEEVCFHLILTSGKDI